jgi:hypothetical protein
MLEMKRREICRLDLDWSVIFRLYCVFRFLDTPIRLAIELERVGNWAHFFCGTTACRKREFAPLIPVLECGRQQIPTSGR